MNDSVKYGGRLFLLVGNSGSGKDTLIRCVAERWVRECPALYTPRRYITRPPHPSESFISLERDAFVRMRTRHGFFLDWVSYGIHYGLPNDITGYLERGAFVLANVSRDVIDRARERYAGTRVVFVKVPYAMTAARLEHRGRELPNSIGYNARLLRARRNPGHPSADYVLDNGGDIDTAVEHLSDYMMSQREDAALNRHYLTGVQS